MLQPYKSFGMVCAKQQCTNHAKPSLRSGADLKVKPMLGGRFQRPESKNKIVLVVLLCVNVLHNHKMTSKL